MNRIDKLNARFCYLFILGTWLVTALTFSSRWAIAQTVVETLPAPPQLNKSNESQIMEEVFVPRDLDFRIPEPSITQKTDSYLVYIDNTNLTQLEQIKQTVPTAFRRQYQGKFVIQAGVFNQESNAISLWQKLQFQGINARLFNLTTEREVAINSQTLVGVSYNAK